MVLDYYRIEEIGLLSISNLRNLALLISIEYSKIRVVSRGRARDIPMGDSRRK